MKRFFTEHINGKRVVLTGTERDHCIKVLRTSVGDPVEVVDGIGGLGKGVLVQYDKREAVIELSAPLLKGVKPPMPVIAIAIPKNPSRWEYFLEKATEIGIGEIVPLICHRSEKRKIRDERSRQVILSAFKQSQRLYLPVLHDVVNLTDFIGGADYESECFIAHCPLEEEAAGDENQFLGVLHKKGEKALILIGPEGDFTMEEISLAQDKGFKAVSLGSNRLRVETAGLAACSIIGCIDQLT